MSIFFPGKTVNVEYCMKCHMAFAKVNSWKNATFVERKIGIWIFYFTSQHTISNTTPPTPQHTNSLSKAIIMNTFLTKSWTNTIEQPSHLPDKAPADFFLFRKLKLPLHNLSERLSFDRYIFVDNRNIFFIPLIGVICECVISEWYDI